MLMTTAALLIAIFAAIFSGIYVIKKASAASAEQTLMLLCESGEKNLDHYFESVEQSVEMVSAYVEADLDGLDDERLQAHLDRVSEMFERLTYKTFGVLTYYYRIDPTVSTNAKGFWFVNLDGEGFREHEVTDITLYDTEDTSALVWFTVPKATGDSIWLPLSNGMRLNVTVPENEIYATWTQWTSGIAIAFVLLLVIFIALLLQFTGHITRPLRNLTLAAEQVDRGNYDCELEYEGKDEVGTLTKTFKKLVTHLKTYIKDLNDLAYADALTSLHNKGAFDVCINDMQAAANENGSVQQFAVCIFDCNDLKEVNDQNGHEKGDIYLKETATIICEVFENSPVFRIGGDEFAAVLLNRDYANRDELLRRFDELCAQTRQSTDVSWERIDVARGMAVYDANEDKSISDVVRRADRLMYENKWIMKEKRARGEA